MVTLMEISTTTYWKCMKMPSRRFLGLPPEEQAVFKARLKKIMESAKGIGWGYYDGLCDSYHEAFPDE